MQYSAQRMCDITFTVTPSCGDSRVCAKRYLTSRRHSDITPRLLEPPIGKFWEIFLLDGKRRIHIRDCIQLSGVSGDINRCACRTSN